jgi:hypothetical protein
MGFVKGDANINRDGRVKGSTNAISKDLKIFFACFLDHNKEKLQSLFDDVCRNSPPEKAIELYLKMAGYVIPKPTNKEALKEPEQTTLIVLPEKDIIQKI